MINTIKVFPEHKPRRPLEDDKPDYYQESDNDYMQNNITLIIALLQAHEEGLLYIESGTSNK